MHSLIITAWNGHMMYSYINMHALNSDKMLTASYSYVPGKKWPLTSNFYHFTQLAL